MKYLASENEFHDLCTSFHFIFVNDYEYIELYLYLEDGTNVLGCHRIFWSE